MAEEITKTNWSVDRKMKVDAIDGWQLTNYTTN